MASVRGGDPELLNAKGWAIVRAPGGRREGYERARTWAEAARFSNPLHAGFMNTLGIANYRLDRFDAALTMLRNADSTATWLTGGGGHRTNVAFQALTSAQLGQDEKARAAFERLQLLMREPQFARDADCRRAQVEAEGSL